MKYLKKFEDIKSVNNYLIREVMSKFKEIGWWYRYFSYIGAPEISIQKDDIRMEIDKERVNVFYKDYFVSFEFKEFFKDDYFLVDFEILEKIVIDVEKYCELSRYSEILIDNQIIERELVNVEDIEMWNNDIEKLIPEYDYLFSGEDMGLL